MTFKMTINIHHGEYSFLSIHLIKAKNIKQANEIAFRYCDGFYGDSEYDRVNCRWMTNCNEVAWDYELCAITEQAFLKSKYIK